MKNSRFLTSLASFACVLAALLAAPALHAEPANVRVFFLSGQSNMATGGSPRSPIANPPLPGDVWYRQSTPPDEPGSDQWTPLRDVLTRGPESSFGEQIAAAFPGDIIAIVKCARGGSGISEFLPDGIFFPFMNARLAAVEADLNQRVTSGEIAGWSYGGFIWMQGENDAAAAAVSYFGESYLRHLGILIAAIRERTGVADLPFVLGRIYDFGLHQVTANASGWTNLFNVREAQIRLPVQDARSAWVNTDDLPMIRTEPHYTSYEEMGRRFAHAYLNIHNNTQIPFRPAQVAYNPSDPTHWLAVPMVATPGPTRVTLDWAHSINATSYSIHYGTSPTALTQSVVGLTANQATITGLVNGTTYYFALRSHNSSGQSPLTDTVSATPAPDANGTPFVWTQDIKRAPHPDSPGTTPYSSELELDQTLALDGTVRDDSTSITTTWSTTSGPGTVTFGNASAIDTSATFSATGLYVLRLTANDGSHTAFHELAVNVRSIVPNAPPTVDILAHPTINELDNAKLDAVFQNNDRKPAGSTYTFLWEKLDGPGVVTIQKPTQWATPASFSQPGTYRLRLTANDGGLSAIDTLTVAVNPAGTRNWALGKPTSESSLFSYGSTMALAVNGDVKDTNTYDSPIFSTNGQANPWGAVDIETSTQIDFIRIWNQQDAYASRLSQYYVFVSPEPFTSTDPAATISQLNANGGWHTYIASTAGWPEVIPVNHAGRYVRVQLATTQYLHFKEIEVIGPAGSDTPTGLAATTLASDSIRLAWTDVSGETGYRVRRALSAEGPWTEVGGNLPLNTTSYTDTGLAELTTYFYQVQSFNSTAPSAWSASVSSRTLSALLTPDLGSATPAVAVVGSPYSHDLDVIGGVPPYSIRLEGNAPAGLSIDNEGVLSGTPTLGGTWNFAVRIQDDDGNVVTKPIALLVSATNYARAGGVSAAQSSDLGGMTAARAIDDNISTENHTNDDAQAWWQIDLGQPVPLEVIQIHNRLDSASRLTNFYILLSNSPFTGTLNEQLADPNVIKIHEPSQALFPSTYRLPADLPKMRYVRVRLSDHNYLHMAEFRALGSLPPVLPAQTPPSANRAAPYSARLSAYQGHGALAWSLAAGQSLPAGLSLSTDGILSGTPTVSGTFPVTFRVTDTLSQTAEREVTLTIPDTLANLWQASHFTNPTTNSSAAWDADPDGDGRLNLFEYALGLSPVSADHPIEDPVLFSIENSNPFFTVGPLRKDPNLLYTVEFSTDLVTWESGPTTYSLRTIDDGNGWITLEATDQQSMAFLTRRFARLKVQLASP